MDTIKVFESNFLTLIKNNIRNYSLQNIENKDNSPSNEKWCASGETNLSCSICRTEFKDRSQQLEHYKLDWHRYNLKLSLQQKVPVSESEFNKKTENADLSSISGSDSEDDSTEDVLTSKGKVYLKNESGQIIAVHTCLIADKKEIITDDILYPRLFECCQENPQWTILMLGGGHFAGAVFRGQETLVHKTFHCYTVRAGQGGSQSSRDSKSATSQPKSAGASLRRENEQALVKHVNDLVDSWRPLIEDSSLIIYRASGPNNLKVLFGGNPPLLKKTDKRLRSIPFSTRRATFSEVSRVHGLLMSAFIYSNLPEDIRKPAPTKSHINRAKSRERPERPLPVKILSSDSETENDATFRHVLEDLTVSFTDELQEFGDSLTPEQRKKGPKKVRPSKTSKTKKLKEKEDARKKEIIEVIKNGDIDKLGELLDSRLSIIQEEIEPETEKSEEDIRNSFFNEVLDDKGNTPLHIAAVNGQNDMVKYLLKNNSNPCLKNLKHVTVYASIQDKDIRETFKQFAKDNPDKYNYNKAHIPVQTLTEEELAEKKRQRNVIKRQKEKEKKKELEKQRKETEEKERFLKLSDREKSALAAERRIANKTGAILIRCFQCGIDITGKVPFEYSNNKFCAINCLKEHRLSHPVILS